MRVLRLLDLSGRCASLQRDFAPLAPKQCSLRWRRLTNCLQRSLLRGLRPQRGLLVLSHLLTSFRWGGVVLPQGPDGPLATPDIRRVQQETAQPTAAARPSKVSHRRRQDADGQDSRTQAVAREARRAQQRARDRDRPRTRPSRPFGHNQEHDHARSAPEAHALRTRTV